MTSKCDCGYPFTEKDIGIVDEAPVEYYPYEGNVYTFTCQKCGCITTLKEEEVKLS